MAAEFTLSVNILRDVNRRISYIKTPNGERAANQILNDFKKGTRSFTLIGSYGTGKSSFLVALEQTLNGYFPHFNLNAFQNQQVECINLVGEYVSLADSLADLLEIPENRRNSTSFILEALYNRFHDLNNPDAVVLLAIDEFGKFLEYAAKNNPESELYFIQKLAEFANDPKRNFLLVTTVHQNIDSYAYGLTKSQRQEWSKIKGRFREIPFNEPVEQLLFLASEFLKGSAKSDSNKIASARELVINSKAVSINPEASHEISINLYPMDLIAASAVSQGLQYYGQNDRSLFSFLESTDQAGLSRYDSANNPFYNLACVYDYLIYNFYSHLTSTQNKDFLQWASIAHALEEVEGRFEKGVNDYLKLAKTIGLLQLFSHKGAKIDRAFLVGYAQICLGISEAETKLSALETYKIIAFRNVLNRFVLVGGMDLDINQALEEAGAQVDEVRDVTTLLKKQIQFDSVLAKEHSYKTGSPRHFSYEISENPINLKPQGEIDGYINLIFNEFISAKDVEVALANCDNAILFGFYRESLKVKTQLFDIEKTRKVIAENKEDKVAIKELETILLHQENLLKHFILKRFYGSDSDVVWFFQGSQIEFSNKRSFNKFLSEICNRVYSKAPAYRSELVNRHKLSAAVSTAKKAYFKALTENWDKLDLGFDKDRFPPEKTIYETLLKANGIHLLSDKLQDGLAINPDSSFNEVWKASEDFLYGTKNGKRPISEFLTLLRNKPFKLKEGLIEFWVGSFLFLKRNDFSLFASGSFIPNLTMDVLDSLVWNAKEFEIKAFNLEGPRFEIFNNYRILLNQQPTDKESIETFIETVKPFLVFYRSLPVYSQKTNRLTKQTIQFRQTIAAAKDPEKLFFEEFPLALGFSITRLVESPEALLEYSNALQSSIKELRTAYSSLLDRFEEFIQNEIVGEKISFLQWKDAMKGRYKKLKPHLVLHHQKVFLQRIEAPIETRDDYLESLSIAILGKASKGFSDQDELSFYEKFRDMVFELDNLQTMSKVNINPDTEMLLGIQVNSFVGGLKKGLVRMPKNKQPEVDRIENEIRKLLSTDKSVNIAAIASILKDQITE
jgi:hypothetical protein